MRPDKDTYYLNIAKSVSERSTCLRAQCGAILVKDDAIISTGYNGNPRGSTNCCDKGICPRASYKPQEGTHLCNAIHAEMNSLMNLAMNGGSSSKNSTLYVWFKRQDDSINTYNRPCDNCMKHIINAGICKIITYTECKDHITIDNTLIINGQVATINQWYKIK